jgi:hypothetical protein
MKKKPIVPGPRPPAGPLVIVDLHDRVPAMSDDALSTLHANALRLVQSGNERQRTSANALMPVIETELALREANKPVKKPRAAAKKKKVALAPASPIVIEPTPDAPEAETA